MRSTEMCVDRNVCIVYSASYLGQYRRGDAMILNKRMHSVLDPELNTETKSHKRTTYIFYFIFPFRNQDSAYRHRNTIPAHMRTCVMCAIPKTPPNSTPLQCRISVWFLLFPSHPFYLANTARSETVQSREIKEYKEAGRRRTQIT